VVLAAQPAERAQGCAPRLDDLPHRRGRVHTDLRALGEHHAGKREQQLIALVERR